MAPRGDMDNVARSPAPAALAHEGAAGGGGGGAPLASELRGRGAVSREEIRNIGIL